jgi:hypothetical protein
MPSSAAHAQAVVVLSLFAAGCTTGVSQEVDPLYASGAAAEVSSSDINDWNAAHAWGNHAEVGYLREEQDPLFSASPAAGIDAAALASWDTAAAWGDHAAAGYLQAESDPSFTASPAAGISAAEIEAWTVHDHDARYYTRAQADARYEPRAAGTRYLQVTSSEFTPRFATPDLDYLGGQGIRFTGTQTGWSLFAGVHLPDGAAVSELRCYLRNNDATEGLSDNSDIRLSRSAVPDDNGSADALAQVFTEVSPMSGVVELAAYAQTAFRVIDNAHYQYYLEASFELSGTSSDMFDPMFRGCRIAYTLP